MAILQRWRSIDLRRDWLPLAVLAALVLLYLPLAGRWLHGWVYKSISIEHEYFSYGLIGFPFAAYLAWERRSTWQQLPAAKYPWGLAILGLAATFYLSRISDLINLSVPLVALGLCWTWKGGAGAKLMAWPLAFVALATPTELPYLVAPHTLVLQEFIAAIAGFILKQIGLPVHVDAIYIYIRDRTVEIAPYCAGLKMLLTSWYVGLMLLYWTGAARSPKKIGLLYVGATLISVTMNILRNTLLAYYHGTGQDYWFDFFHEGTGGDIYSAMMLGVIVLWMQRIDHWWPSATEEAR